MLRVVATAIFAAEEVSSKEDLYPHISELLLGLIAFAILFFFMWKWVLPRVNQTLEARREKIQGDLEKAEEARRQAEEQLEDYRRQLSGAREEANRIIEEARRTAEDMRRDLIQRAEREHQQVLDRAQEEIRAERDRVMQELKTQVGAVSVELAGRIVGESLDRDRQLRLVDDYLDELLATAPSGNGHGPSTAGTGGTSGVQAEPEQGSTG